MFTAKFNVEPFGDISAVPMDGESLLDAMTRVLEDKFKQPVVSMVCQPRAEGTAAVYMAGMADKSVRKVTILM